MGFDGYSVPMADKEARLRHFAPVLLQDGQICVVRDTIMMWLEMSATFEYVSLYLFSQVMKLILVHRRTHDWEAYMSSILDLSVTNATDPGARMDVNGRPI